MCSNVNFQLDDQHIQPWPIVTLWFSYVRIDCYQYLRCCRFWFYLKVKWVIISLKFLLVYNLSSCLVPWPIRLCCRISTTHYRRQTRYSIEIWPLMVECVKYLFVSPMDLTDTYIILYGRLCLSIDIHDGVVCLSKKRFLCLRGNTQCVCSILISAPTHWLCLCRWSHTSLLITFTFQISDCLSDCLCHSPVAIKILSLAMSDCLHCLPPQHIQKYHIVLFMFKNVKVCVVVLQLPLFSLWRHLILLIS